MQKTQESLTLSIIVPIYNEEDNIESFYDTIIGGAESNLKKHDINAYEIIFVDDGSSDKSIEKVRALQERDENVQFIKFSRNFGKESAMLAGLRAARYLLTTIMDCDLQDPPSLLWEMIERYENSDGDLKIITAKRRNRDGDGFFRANLSEAFYKINNILSPIKLQSGVRDFRLIHRDALNSILEMSEYHRFSKAIFEFVGYKKEIIEYDYIERKSGQSKWNFFKLFSYALGGIVSFSTVPLKMISYIGVVIFLLAAAYGTFIVISTLIFGNAVSGYPTIVTLIAFFGGLQIIMLGIIGTYIARIYEQGKHRPHYFVESSSLAKKHRDKK